MLTFPLMNAENNNLMLLYLYYNTLGVTKVINLCMYAVVSVSG